MAGPLWMEIRAMSSSESFPDPVSVELLNTARCYELGMQINDFDNAIFGPDFFCSYETIRPWVEAKNLFCSAFCGEAVSGRRKILSVASLLITSRTSRDSLFSGHIKDYELVPWTLSPKRCEPVIYFASIVSANTDHVRALYDSLSADVEPYLRANGIEVHSAFSIAAGPAGLRHMSKSGFSVWEGGQYLNKYTIMVMEASEAKAPFWQRLLVPAGAAEAQDGMDLGRNSFTTVTPALDSIESGRGNLPAQPAACDDAKEVEKRLALSKADRHRLRQP